MKKSFINKSTFDIIKNRKDQEIESNIFEIIENSKKETFKVDYNIRRFTNDGFVISKGYSDITLLILIIMIFII